MKVLVIDDSAFFRNAIATVLRSEEGVEVVGKASNGEHGLAILKEKKPDLVTVDMEMPVMNGLDFIKALRAFDKNTKILVFSSLTQKGAQITMQALVAGANDFLAKNNLESESGNPMTRLKEELVPKVLQFRPISERATAPTPIKTVSTGKFNLKPEILLIGSSTGGPNALKAVLSRFSPKIDVPVLIVQHMPPMFTNELAKMLDRECPLKVKEAEEGEVIQKGVCYIAPGDYHMEAKKEGEDLVIRLNQNPQVNFVRPAADVLFDSIAPVYKGRALTLVLTGMGFDGREGARGLRKHDAPVIIQDEATSVVWGMPGAIYEAGLHTHIGPLTELGQLVNQFFIRQNATFSVGAS